MEREWETEPGGKAYFRVGAISQSLRLSVPPSLRLSVKHASPATAPGTSISIPGKGAASSCLTRVRAAGPSMAPPRGGAALSYFAGRTSGRFIQSFTGAPKPCFERVRNSGGHKLSQAWRRIGLEFPPANRIRHGRLSVNSIRSTSRNGARVSRPRAIDARSTFTRISPGR